MTRGRRPAGSTAVPVRVARPADKPAILELRREGAVQAFGGSSPEPAILRALVQERVDESKLDLELSDPTCTVLVALVDDRPAGTALIRIRGELGELSSCACTVRGAGVGSALMEARLRLARSAGVRRVWLETDTVNRAGMAHAARHGFTAVRSRPGVRIPGNRVVRFEREL